MDPTKVLALVLAGGEGTRLYPLTAKVAKPAVPLVDGYRLIDFVLSNLVNSGISRIFVLGGYQAQSLAEHLDTAWAPRARGRGVSLRMLLPEGEGVSTYRGTADAVAQNIALIERYRPEYVAVFAADHVYRMDVRQMLSFHWARNAEVTVAAVPVTIESASSFGVITARADGTIADFQEKPERPSPIPGDPERAYVSMGNYIFTPSVLLELLDAASRLGHTDFGHHILPSLPGRRRVYAYNFAGNEVPVLPHEERVYWRDVGTPHSLSAAQFDVMGPMPRLDLRNRSWPIYGAGRAPAVQPDNARRRGAVAAGTPLPRPVLPPQRARPGGAPAAEHVTA